jgi:hypothetical protein
MAILTTVETADVPAEAKKPSRLADWLEGAIMGLALALIVAASWPAKPPAGPGPFDRLDKIIAEGDGFAKGFLAACGDPCIIKANPGGRLGDFKALTDEIIAIKRRVIIEGYCASACAIMADRAREYVRIGKGAQFLFHMTSDETAPPGSSDVDSWVRSHGGYPSFASQETTKMDFDTARRFWRPVFDWYREPRRVDAPLHLPGEEKGIFDHPTTPSLRTTVSMR